MDPFKQTIKQALDEKMYKSLELDEKGKREFISHLQQSKLVLKRRRDYGKVAAVLAGLCAVIILCIITLPYFHKSDIRSGDLQKQIKDEFGQNVIIPTIKDTHIILVTIMEPNTANKELSVAYGLDTEDKVTISKEARKLENENNMKILYGPQNGKPVVFLRYYQGDLRGEQYTESQTLNGFHVFTQTRKAVDRTYYDVQLQVEQGYYEFQIERNDTFTDEKIHEFLDQFTSQLKKQN